MDIPSFSLLLLIAILSAIVPSSSAVQCYVCSWSPKDDSKRTDVCTNERFEPNVVYMGECELGCETFLQWDRNGELEHMRRNCIQKETKMTGKCYQDEDRARSWRHCSCNTDLCNGAISWVHTKLMLLMAVFAIIAEIL